MHHLCQLCIPLSFPRLIPTDWSHRNSRILYMFTNFFGHNRLDSVGHNDKHLLLYCKLCLTLLWNADFCPFLHRTYAHYCSATYNLQHNFPTVVPSQLQSAEEDCAICKEHMKVSSGLMHPPTLALWVNSIVDAALLGYHVCLSSAAGVHAVSNTAYAL